MSGELFDQASLRSGKAQRFADAFAGCGEWIEPPPRRRRFDDVDAPFDGARPEPAPVRRQAGPGRYRRAA